MVTKATSSKRQHPTREGRLRRRSLFSYTCGQCNRCCTNKIIKLNPYEVARLAANRGVSTTDFISRYTMAHGTVLGMSSGADCIFRTSHGCMVYPDRPLVCRLYPLGRHVTRAGEETFSLLRQHPDTKGAVGSNGTVGDYLEGQGAMLYIKAVDDYLIVLRRMVAALQKTARTARGTEERMQRPRPGGVDAEQGITLLDMDRMVAAYCSERGLAMPKDAGNKMTIHLRALEAMARGLAKGD